MRLLYDIGLIGIAFLLTPIATIRVLARWIKDFDGERV